MEQEKKLEGYRRRYAGQLPSQLARQSAVAPECADAVAVARSRSMNRARERRLLVERQMADAQTLPPEVDDASGVGGDRRPPHPAAQQLEAARTRLEVSSVATPRPSRRSRRSSRRSGICRRN